MIKINLRDNIDLIKESLNSSCDNTVECDIIGLTKNGKDKIRFLIDYISKKYLIEKYREDLSYILLEIIVNSLKADYAHLITITNLKMLKNQYIKQIEDKSYLLNREIMGEYAEILKDNTTKEEVKEMLALEGELFKALQNGTYNADKKYNRLHFFKEAFNNKPVIIKLIIIKDRDKLIFRVKNNSPLAIVSRTRIEAKRITLKEYYDNGLIDRFFLEQIDLSESSGFGIALIDLKLLSYSLNPFKHFLIYSKDENTFSDIIIPL